MYLRKRTYEKISAREDQENKTMADQRNLFLDF